MPMRQPAFLLFTGNSVSLQEDYRKITVERKGETNFFTSDMIKSCMKKTVAVSLHQTVQVSLHRTYHFNLLQTVEVSLHQSLNVSIY